jgi:hypothetical protein
MEQAMKSPRTVAMREWLIRLHLRSHRTPASEVPPRTLTALTRGRWVMTDHLGWVVPLVDGSEWVQAFKDGTKSIRCKP